MNELILKEDALNCFHDWIDRYGYEHTADEDPVYQRIAELKSIEDCDDAISRKMAIDMLHGYFDGMLETDTWSPCDVYGLIEILPSVQPERVWHSCKTPPKHHKDVLVRGTEAIGNVTTYKVMQWDVVAWRPTDYAPSIIWEEWSEIYE